VISKTILHTLSEGKKRKRKTSENMEKPVPGNLSWIQNRPVSLILGLIKVNKSDNKF
jgi:hypothetical protein